MLDCDCDCDCDWPLSFRLHLIQIMTNPGAPDCIHIMTIRFLGQFGGAVDGVNHATTAAIAAANDPQ